MGGQPGRDRRRHAGRPCQFGRGAARLLPDLRHPLSYLGAKWAGETHFLIGTYDRPGAFTPHGDAFTAEALAWAKPKRES
jgi:hypothetical protein